MNVNEFGIIGVGSNVQLGKAGPRAVVNSGAVEIKNAANNALAVVRGANAVGSTDFVTLSQIPGIASSLSSRQLSMVYTDTGSINIGAVVPMTAIIVAVLVNVSVVFNGTTPTLEIGFTEAPQLLASTEIDLTTVGVYGGFVYQTGLGTQLLASLAVGGSPSTGACQIIVAYANAT
jgi:hypothetical protein